MLMFHPVPERNQHPMLTAEEQLVLEQLSAYEYSAVRCASHQFQSAHGWLNDKNNLPDKYTPESGNTHTHEPCPTSRGE
jgi:hypothetical protein